MPINFTVSALLKILERIEYGTICVELPDGRREDFNGAQPGPKGHIAIHDLRAIDNCASGGDIAFAKDYQHGLWDSDDLAALIECAIKNSEHFQIFIRGSRIKALLAKLRSYLRLNTKRGSRKNIHAHYDLGNQFYSLWLDPSMTYSSGIFHDEADDLLSAQMNKYDRILSRFGDQPTSILEIGCGWGGFAERGVEQADHHVRGITISDAQCQYARDRLRPLGQQAQIDLIDYRDIDSKFDAIVSIEMFEAVGERYWPSYFGKIGQTLSQKGKAIIQTITIGDEYFENYRRSGDAIRSYIFPGGMLPSQTRFEAEAKLAGLRITDRFEFGQDYARTLSHWLTRFNADAETIKNHGFDEPFMRLWRFYLASCIGAFTAGRTNVMQVELQHL